ncbi:MAG TPA: cellulose biosynthesis cyclic di-GMP-binding regulatory protein BcsB, partial [Rhodocyclaceae bacterium]
SRGRRAAAVAGGLALAAAARYFWWRASASFAIEGQADLTWGMLVLLAEFGVWRTVAFRRPVAGFLAAAAQAVFAATPAAYLLFGLRPVAAPPLSWAVYLVPHACATLLVAARAHRRFYPSLRAEHLAAAWGLLRRGRGHAAPAALAWLNLAALAAGILRLVDWDPAHSGFDAMFVAWAIWNLLPLGMAVAGAQSHARTFPAAPTQTLGAARSGHALLFSALRRWCGPAAATAAARLRWWLPHAPRLAMHAVAAALALAMLALPSVPAAAAQTAPVLERHMTIKEMSGLNALPLRTTDGNAAVYFGARGDEIVTGARLVLRYSYSPSLLAKESHLKITLNDEVMGTAPISAEAAGKPQEIRIPIDPRFIVDHNKLGFRFIGHYAATCEDPLRNSLWAEVSGASEVVVSYVPIPLKDDLSMLPAPFFDRHDLRQLSLPVMFSAAPQLSTVHAAGIVASWFGALAGDRGARFPVQLDRLVPGHGIVMATNSDRPSFLDGHPPVEGPAIEMMTNPADGVSKLLLVLGRDGNDIEMAAQSLALGHEAMTGTHVAIRSRRDDARRQPYDAPNWVRGDRPTRLGDMLAYAEQLQAVGHNPPPLKLDLNVPPDLFRPGARGVPMTLRYRYSPPVRNGESLLTVSANGTLVQSYELTPRNGGGPIARFVRNDDSLLDATQRLTLPAYALSGRNRLEFAFAFARYQEGPCPDVPPDDARRALIDPDSTIDFSGFYHLARMPNLNHFASVGYPFTRYADLSDTVLVLPEHPATEEIEAALALLGEFGRSTGVPASRVQIAGPGEASQLENANLLIVGSALRQGVPAQWGDYLPASLDGKTRQISRPERALNFLYDWLGFGPDDDASVATSERLVAEGPMAMLLGFQSPLSPGYSAVAVTATAPDQLWQAVAALGNPDLASRIHGSVALIRGQRVSSLMVGDTYFIGDLPWWVAAWLPMSRHPLLLALATVAAVVLLSLAAWQLRHRRRRRHHAEENVP